MTTTPRRRQSDIAQDEALEELKPLTEHQREVLVFFAKGCTVVQTSRLLGIKDRDVHNERSRIASVLECTMIEAAMTAKTAGWV